MERLSRQLKAVSDPQRLRILALLAFEGECAVSEIQQVLSISASAASRSLRTLEETGWLERRRDSRWIYYSFVRAPEGLAAVANALLRRLQQDPQLLADRDTLHRERRTTTNGQAGGDHPAVRPGTAVVPDDEPAPATVQPSQPSQQRVELPYATAPFKENHRRTGQGLRRPAAPTQPPVPTPPAKPAKSSSEPKKKKRGILFDFGHK